MCTIARDIAFNGLLLDNNHKVGAAQDIRTIAHGIPQSPYRSRNTCTTSREMLLSNRKPPCHISDDESESDSSSKCVGDNRLFCNRRSKNELITSILHPIRTVSRSMAFHHFHGFSLKRNKTSESAQAFLSLRNSLLSLGLRERTLPPCV